MIMDEFRILSPTAILGYGFPVESFEEGMRRKPHVISVDAGSTDPGPYYLGAGKSFTDRYAVKRDLDIILNSAIKANIPVIIGTAGGSGARPHLLWNMDIIREVALESDLSFKMAVIHSDVSNELVLRKHADGQLKPLHPAPDITSAEIEQSARIVGQMGIEPIIKALDMDVHVVLAGRAYDPAVFAAPAIKQGLDKGLAIHLGKILECACIAAIPGSGSDCILGILRKDHFLVETLNPVRKCTTLSVAAHTLYEKTNPYILPGPGGVLDLTETEFLQETENSVRVSGSKYIQDKKYCVKLEGVKRIGFRTISIAGVRDPIFIGKIDEIIEGVRARTADNFKSLNIEYRLDFKLYGKNGVMRDMEPLKHICAHELGIVIDVIAKTQQNADTICSFARSAMLHYGYEGRISTAGNLAFPYSPSDVQLGEVFVFNIYHLAEVNDPYELFKIEMWDK